MCNYCKTSKCCLLDDCTAKKLHKKIACKNISRLLEKLGALITLVQSEEDDSEVIETSQEVADLATIFFDAYDASPYFTRTPIPNSTRYIFQFIICACIFVPIFACNAYANNTPLPDDPIPIPLDGLVSVGDTYIEQDIINGLITYSQALCKLRDCIEKAQAYIDVIDCNTCC